MKAKVIVGMSGGVDSSVAAWLLREQGYEVEGLFMKNWEEDDEEGYCAAAEDLADAKDVCAQLNIPLHGVNFAKEYWDRVFSYFLNEYQHGRTPNPDVLCNKEIKFQAFLNHALSLGGDYIATGHYARLERIEGSYPLLLKAKDRNKDQTYFLHAVARHALAKTLFPVGDYLKSQIRDIAKALNLPTHAKKDSTGICFIGERRFKTFLNEYMLAEPGEIQDNQGKKLGRHDGLMFYTLGQRQGLKIGGQQGTNHSPWYVVEKNIEDNILVVAQGIDHPMLYVPGLICGPIHWLIDEHDALPRTCYAKTRYRQEDQACMISPPDDGRHYILFSVPQRAITPGQFIVFYDKNRCLGGAVIEAAIR